MRHETNDSRGGNKKIKRKEEPEKDILYTYGEKISHSYSLTGLLNRTVLTRVESINPQNQEHPVEDVRLRVVHFIVSAENGNEKCRHIEATILRIYTMYVIIEKYHHRTLELDFMTLLVRVLLL